MPNSTQAWLHLLHTPGIGSKTLSKLLRQFPDAAAILAADAQSLRQAGLSEKKISALQTPDQQAIDTSLWWLEQDNHHLLCVTTPDSKPDVFIPSALQAIDDPPPVLFAKGDLDLLKLPGFGIVGSRSPTKDGLNNAKEFAKDLAAQGLVICSGLAQGVDTAAHQGALLADGATIAVTGTGLDRVYPAQNLQLAHQIAEQGLLLSEFPLGTNAVAGNFPRRNRIISGLSVGVLVVEAALQSGSLITARLAMEQGREVFAIPGSIHNPLARGCHRLIQEGAKLVEFSADIWQEIAPNIDFQVQKPDIDTRLSSEPPTLERNLTFEQHQLLDAVDETPTALDQITARSGLTVEAVSSMLLILELDGYVESVKGGFYARTRSQ